jgi:hypothetical protein
MIVPFSASEDVTAGKARIPHFTYHYGPVLSAVEVVTVFWGAAWEKPFLAGLATQLDEFFDFVLTSPLMDVLVEYGVRRYPIGYGRRTGSFVIATSEPGEVVTGGRREVSDEEIQLTLGGWIASGTVSAPNPNTVYFVYLPPDVVAVLAGLRSDDNPGFCGYHNQVGSTTFYAVATYTRCHRGPEMIDSLTAVSSHELCELITDPALTAWFDDSVGDEIADVCSEVGKLRGYTVQLVWSNRQGGCVLSPPPRWLAATPRAACSADRQGNLHVLAIDQSDRLWHALRRGADGTWTPLRLVQDETGRAGPDVGPTPFAACAAAPAGDLHVLAIDRDNRLWHALRRGADGAWTALSPVQDETGRAGPDVGPTPFAACAADPAGDLHVLAINDNQDLWHGIRRAADGTWTALSPVQDETNPG